jgi:NAD(P)-dependent dehydrogenase (short-subunit alcohol dehydrogenase family)
MPGEAGADVALNALTPKYVNGTAAEIAAASGRRVVPVVADVTKPDEAGRAVASVLETFGRIDVLVNALGDSIRKPLVPLPDGAAGVSDEELQFIMDINLTEALPCTRAVGPRMLERRSGKVINIVSRAINIGAIRLDPPGSRSMWRRSMPGRNEVVYPRPRYPGTSCVGIQTPSGGAPLCQKTSIGIPPRGYQ